MRQLTRPSLVQIMACRLDGILLIGPLGTNFSEILIEIQIFLFRKMHLKMSSAKCRPFCLGLNVLMGSSGHLGCSTYGNEQNGRTIVPYVAAYHITI